MRDKRKTPVWIAPSARVSPPISVLATKTDEASVDHRGGGSRGQDLADDGVARQPHHEVAGLPLLEKGIGELDEVLEKGEGHPRVEVRLHVEEEVAPDHRRQEVEEDDEEEPESQDHEEAIVFPGDDPVDQEPCQDGHRQGEELDQEREDRDPGERVRLP
jgi:hypothetical protein